MTMKDIVKAYKNDTLGEDESGAGGFWDEAGDIASSFGDKIMENKEVEELQESIYNILTELHEVMK